MRVFELTWLQHRMSLQITARQKEDLEVEKKKKKH